MSYVICLIWCLTCDLANSMTLKLTLFMPYLWLGKLDDVEADIVQALPVTWQTQWRWSWRCSCLTCDLANSMTLKLTLFRPYQWLGKINDVEADIVQALPVTWQTRWRLSWHCSSLTCDLANSMTLKLTLFRSARE